MTYLLSHADANAAGTGLRWDAFAPAASNFRTGAGVRSMPVSIPADQAYYWSYRWQESERKAREDLANGRSRIFTDPMDAVRHLLQ